MLTPAGNIKDHMTFYLEKLNIKKKTLASMYLSSKYFTSGNVISAWWWLSMHTMLCMYVYVYIRYAYVGLNSFSYLEAALG